MEKNLDTIIIEFEEKYPEYRWKLFNRAYDNGVYLGDGKKQLMVYSPFSSGGNPNWSFVTDNYINCFIEAMIYLENEYGE